MSCVAVAATATATSSLLSLPKRKYTKLSAVVSKFSPVTHTVVPPATGPDAGPVAGQALLLLVVTPVTFGAAGFGGTSGVTDTPALTVNAAGAVTNVASLLGMVRLRAPVVAEDVTVTTTLNVVAVTDVAGPTRTPCPRKVTTGWHLNPVPPIPPVW